MSRDMGSTGLLGMLGMLVLAVVLSMARAFGCPFEGVLSERTANRGAAPLARREDDARMLPWLRAPGRCRPREVPLLSI
jgi:hypothetical protein